MTKDRFREIMEEMSCRVVDDTAFGRQGAYPFSVELANPKTNTLVLRFILGGETQEAAAREAAGQTPMAQEAIAQEAMAAGAEAPPASGAARAGKEEKGARRPLKAALARLRANPGSHTAWYANPPALEAVINPPSDFYVKAAIRSALGLAAKTLAETGDVPPATCPLCGLGGCDADAWVEGGFRPVHAACVATRLQLPETDDMLQGKRQGSWATGVVGALLGAFVGAVPAWATALSRNTLSALLYAFIPFFSMLLYRLLRGKAHRTGGALIVFGSSLVAIFGLELFWHWLTLTASSGINLSFWVTTANFFRNFRLLPQIRSMLFSLVFFCVGMFPAAVVLRRYAATGKDGLRPRRGAAFARQSLWKNGDPGGEPSSGAEASPGEG